MFVIEATRESFFMTLATFLFQLQLHCVIFPVFEDKYTVGRWMGKGERSERSRIFITVRNKRFYHRDAASVVAKCLKLTSFACLTRRVRY